MRKFNRAIAIGALALPLGLGIAGVASAEGESHIGSNVQVAAGVQGDRGDDHRDVSVGSGANLSGHIVTRDRDRDEGFYRHHDGFLRGLLDDLFGEGLYR